MPDFASDQALKARLLDILREPDAALAQSISSTVRREIFGQDWDTFDVDKLAVLVAGFSAAEYAVANMGGAQRCGNAHELLSFALSQAQPTGLFMEFGVFSGRSISHIAQVRPQNHIYGFDSFEGLPEKWRDGFEKGAFGRSGLPAVPRNVELIKGWFDHTLPGFCAAHAGEPAAFIHVDCDLYSSTHTVLANLKPHIGAGTVIVFDEYYNYPGWQKHEFRAFQEFCSAERIAYRYIGLVPHGQQAAVQVLGRT